jgi:DNA-binding CsgD family transcriptional regulator
VATVRRPPTVLEERKEELATIEEVVAAGAAGDGAVLVIEGPPGIGKSALVSAARETAGAAGLNVRPARCSTFERDFPFGVARQLLEPLLHGASEEERERLLDGPAAFAASVISQVDADAAAGAQVDNTMRAFNALYWLTAHAADDRPLCLLVDDAHWADTSSLRWLAFLATRIEGLALTVVVAARPEGRDAAGGAIEELALGDAARVARPATLSAQGTAALVADRFGREGDAAFVEACSRATGGNPFLLSELLRTLADDGATPDAAAAAAVVEVTPDTVARSVRRRLDGLQPDADALARSLVVLGGEEDIGVVAEHAGLGAREAAAAADALREATILAARPSPIAFLHPIVAGAVASGIGWGELSDAHRRAADLLDRRGAPADRRAVHLLACDPAGDADVAATLVDAARDVTARGALDAAVRFAERALREPPPPELMGAALQTLASAKLLDGAWAEAADDFRAALEHETDVRERAVSAIRLLDAQLGAGVDEETASATVPLLHEVSEALGDQDEQLTLSIESVLWSLSQARLGTLMAVGPPPEPLDGILAARVLTPIQRLRLARWALLMGAAGAVDANAALAMAKRALGDGELLCEVGPMTAAYYVSPSSLWLFDDLDAAVEVFDGMVDDVAQLGSPAAMRTVRHLRAVLFLRAGRLDRVEEEAEAAGVTNEPWGVRLGRFCLAEARAERADHDGAQRALAEGMDTPADALETGFGSLVFDIRGRVALAAGRPEQALIDFQAAGDFEQLRLMASPLLSSWRAGAALTLRALGRDDEASERAGEAVEQARRFGAARPLGLALRAHGLVTGSGESLAEAVEVLDGSPAWLERAHALVAYGEFLRRDGKRTEARTHLRDGLEVALECGATVLTVRAREELRLAGGRAPHRRPEQRDELTPSERRVVALARDGSSNREIAQTLFLTEKTVETHLSSAYRKLGIRRRTELAQALSS